MFTIVCYLAMVSTTSAHAPVTHASIQIDGDLQSLDYDVGLPQHPHRNKAMVRLFRREPRLKQDTEAGLPVGSWQTSQARKKAKAFFRRENGKKQFTSFAEYKMKRKLVGHNAHKKQAARDPHWTHNLHAGFTLVGEGWCRPSGCEVTDNACRTNGFFKDMGYYQDANNEIECVETCQQTSTCIGYSYSTSQYVDSPNRCYVHTMGDAVPTPSGWTTYAYSHYDVAAFRALAFVQCHRKILCTVPTIPVGAASWSGLNCASGATNVAEGTTCTITAEPGHQCTSPGLCLGPFFAATASCVAVCVVPTISDGVSSWSGSDCGSGATVSQGTSCTINSADGYQCISPGLCGADGFELVGTCTACQNGVCARERCGPRGPDCQAGIDKVDEYRVASWKPSVRSFICGAARACWADNEIDCAPFLTTAESTPEGSNDPNPRPFCPARGVGTCYDMGNDCMAALDLLEQQNRSLWAMEVADQAVYCGSGLTCFQQYPTECEVELGFAQNVCAVYHCGHTGGGDCATATSIMASSGADGPSAEDEAYVCTTGLACFKVNEEACSRLIQLVEGTLEGLNAPARCSQEQIATADALFANGSAAQAAEAHKEIELNRTLDDAGLAEPDETSSSSSSKFFGLPILYWVIIGAAIVILGGGVAYWWQNKQKPGGESYGDDQDEVSW